MKKTHLAGFTLIELSITLIIIALLAGGILVGRDMINAAEIRAAARQIESFNTAYTAFLLKYNCMPGDCGNATDFGFTPMVVTVSQATPEPKMNVFDHFSPISDTLAAVVQGGGQLGCPMCMQGQQQVNMTIAPDGDTFDPAFRETYIMAAPQTVLAGGNGDGDYKTTPLESLGAQVELGQANMMPGQVDVIEGNYPMPLSSGNTNPYTHHRPSLLQLTLEQTTDSLFPETGSFYVTSTTLISNSAGMASFTASQAYALDAKIDDGQPLSGIARATGTTVFNPPYLTFNANTDSGSTRCINNGQYNVRANNDPSDVLSLCALGIKSASL